MERVEYAEFSRAHARVLRQLLLDLDFYIEDLGSVGVFSVESRVKDFQSADDKSRRTGIAIEELQDIAGIRVVVATRSDVDVIKRFFSRRASISKDLEILEEKPLSKRDGYRSTHLITRFSGHYSRSVRSGHLEVQIPTILEYAFNFISHAWVYKSPTHHDPKWTRRFRSVSKRLAKIDEDVAALHGDACEESRFEPDKERLSPHLFRRVVREQFDEEVSIESAVDSVVQYRGLGVQTVAQLQEFFRHPEVEALWDEFRDPDLPFRGTKLSFWDMFGTRLDRAREFLEATRKRKP